MQYIDKSLPRFRVYYQLSQHRFNSKVVRAVNIQEAMRKIANTGRRVTGAESA